MNGIDFLNIKHILYYILTITILLLLGFLIEEGIAILFFMTILYYLLSKKIFQSIETFFIWYFISNFFIGQGYITNEIIIKYIAKPSFLLFIVFIFFINRIPRQFLNTRFILFWFLYILSTLLSSIYNDQSVFVIITSSTIIMSYLIIQSKGLNKNDLYKFLNLFVAVAVVQTVVSFLQVTEILNAPVKIMQDGDRGDFLWQAGLDDASSGMFGAVAGHVASWYAALVSFFLFIMWIFLRKNSYLIIMIISFLQFATLDSKTE
jgi:hypothetical protein